MSPCRPLIWLLILRQQGVPDKGIILTLMTAHWFHLLQRKIPNLRTHFITLDLPSSIPDHLRPQLKHRSMQVRRLKIFPIEAIVRGFITGSAWSSYQKTGLVNGRKLPPGLRESEAFPEPIYTPSTKAELGQHDENISIEEATQIVGPKYARQIEKLSLQIYMVANEYAMERGIIIADTKFEFGLDEATDEVVLVDEVLTPDSSRFWSRQRYDKGRGQDSFDKQYLRNWLTANGLKGQEGVQMPPEVVEGTAQKYKEAFEILTGTTLGEVLRS